MYSISELEDLINERTPLGYYLVELYSKILSDILVFEMKKTSRLKRIFAIFSKN